MRFSVRFDDAFRLLTFVIVCALWSASASAQTPVQSGFRDFSFGTKVNQNPTGEKPQAKLWFNDGKWWGSLFNPSAEKYQIYRFEPSTQSWVDTGTPIDSRVDSKADALWDEGTQRLYIVSHVFSESASATSSSSTWGKLFRYSYSSGSQIYSLDAGFPVDVTRGRTEALSVAKDFNQRLWVTYVEGGRVKINWSLASDTAWGTPINLPVSGTSTTVSSDDISAIVAYPNGDIGVMWSNQKTKSVYFTKHRSTDAPTVWQAVETVLPGIGCTGACADDHLNLKIDQTGRVFAILKTSLDTSGKPNQILAVRDATKWTLYIVTLGQQNQTRGLVMLDEEQGKVYLFTSDTGGGTVYMKSSSMDTIGFASGFGQPFIKSSSDIDINDATSTKQNISLQTGLLVLASDEVTRRYLHNYLSLAPPAPAPPFPPSELTATAESASQVHLSWIDNANNELAFEVERAEGNGPFAPLITLSANTTSYNDNSVTAAHTYRYRVWATNAIGPSLYSDVATVATPAPPGEGNLKVITFEGGSITDLATGVDSVSGTVSLETSSPLKENYSARITTRPAYVQETFPATPNLYLSFYIRVNTLPTSDVNLLRIMNNGSQVGTLLLRPGGQLRLRNNSTTVGSDSAPLAAGQLYRIGLHQRAKVGSVYGVLEAFLVTGDAPFNSPFAALTNGSWTSSATELRLGTITSVAVSMVLDDIKLDNTLMPTAIPGPEEPTGLTASAVTATAVELLWNDASTDETAFHIERATSSGVFIDIATVSANVTTYTDLSVTPATAYTYRVRGENGGVFGQYSNPAPVTTPDVEPDAPSGLDASAPSSNAVFLTWTDNASNETMVLIERAGSDGIFAPLITLGPNTTSHIDSSVAAATHYSYKVRAGNGVGYSDYSNSAAVTTLLPVVPPADPSNLIATAPASNQVQLTWADNSATETLFRIERATGGGAFSEIGTTTSNVTTFTDPTVVAGVAYTYQVRASSNLLLSGYSNQVSVTPPTAPTPAGAALKLMTFESGTITDPVTGADSVSGTVTFETASPLKGTRSAKVTGSAYFQKDFAPAGDLYYTFYLRFPSAPSSDVRFAFIQNNGRTVGNLVLRSTGQLRLRNDSTAIGADSAPLAAGTVYRVLLHQRTSPRLLEAFVVAGEAPFGPAFASSTSASISGTADRIRMGGTSGSISAVFDDVRLDAGSPPPSTAPDAPTSLAVLSSSASAVVLTWDDNATTEETMRVDRSVGGGAFVEIASLPGNVTSYTDTSVSANTLYGYRVRAVNVAGSSAPSDEATTTTPAGTAPPDAPSALAAIAASSTEVNLTWTNAATNETSVHVERSTSGGAFVEIAVLGADAESLSDVFTAAGTNYIYRVRVANSEFSNYSNEFAVTTP